MKNILREAISREELVAILKNSPAIPLLPPMTDPAWKNAAKKPSVQPWLKKLQDLALLEADQPMPELTDELYEDYAATGIRLNFERLYFDRRRRLARAAMAVLTMEDRGSLLKLSLINKIQSIFDEVSWALPAHVQNKRGQDPMRIDLFAAETANLFGELINIFGPIMPAGLKAEIRWRLRKQFFENYFNVKDWWLTITNNWNAVCHQGVFGAALALEEDVDLLADMLLRMKEYLPNFLKGFGADGGTAEGPGYWSYGFGWYAVLNEQLEKRTRGELSIFEGDLHVAAMARFGPFGLLEKSHLLNFSDSPPEGTLRASVVQYLADRLKDPVLAQTAKVCWNSPLSEARDLSNLRSDLFCLTRMLLLSPENLEEASLPIQDVYLPDTQWMLTRSRDARGQIWEFAAKAGHNAEHHNHNDVGSYMLNVDGQRVVAEIGAPEYTREFFSDQRYTFLAARSLGHSVPLVNGIEQAAGEHYRGVVAKQEFGADQTLFAVDLTAAYPAESQLIRLTRTLEFEKAAGKLKVRDAFELRQAGTIETAMIVTDEPTCHEAGVTFNTGGKTYLIKPLGNTVVAGVQRHDYHKHHGGDAHIFRIALAPATVAASGTIEFVLTQV